jgi:hypothetical protein
MKKLIAIMVLGLSLGFSALSFASDYTDLYTNGPAVHELESETQGGEVETSPMSFYFSPVKAHINNDTLRTAEETESDKCALMYSASGSGFRQVLKSGGITSKQDSRLFYKQK